MKILRFFFIKVPRKIYFVLRHKCEHIYYCYIYSTPEFNTEFVPRRYLLFGGAALTNASEIYSQLFPHQGKNIVKDADNICDHIFDLLGSGSKRLSVEGKGYQNIDWHIDFKSGYRWDSRTFYRYISFGHQEGVDIKVPWELSRFQHLNTLGQAYIITTNKKYLDEYLNQINDWIDNNPVCFGVNWGCAMDVAIRAINWLVAMEYFAGDIPFPREFMKKFYLSIYEHGKYIRKHLEYSAGWTTNHYLADIVGLFFIAVYCPFFIESMQWHKFAIVELHNEIETQICADGCSFEASTSYHRLVLEMFFYAGLLDERTGAEFSESYKEKAKQMFEVILYCIKPNGMIPQIGDNDSGRLLKFSLRHVLDYRYLMSLAAIHQKDSSFKIQGFDLDEEAFWVFGEKAKTTWDILPSRETFSGAKSFPNAGWYIIRHENDYCIVSCGSNGGDGWHSHNDKLSFELTINGYDFIVDPGTYVYTSNPIARNTFRSTEYHNTIKFDEYEQNEISDKHMFLLSDRVEIKDVALTETQDEVVFQGEIRYADISHRRMIAFDKKASEWQITDIVSSGNQISVELLFHLSPEVTYDGSCILTKDESAEKFLIEVDGQSLIQGEYYYSPEYGVKIEAESLKIIAMSSENEKKIITRIYRG